MGTSWSTDYYLHHGHSILRSSSNVPKGCIVMDSIQQFNFHLLAGDVHSFRRFDPPDPEEGPFELLEVSGHVRLLPEAVDSTAGIGSASDLCQRQAPLGGAHGQIEVDAKALAASISRTYFGRVVAVNEVRVRGGINSLLDD